MAKLTQDIVIVSQYTGLNTNNRFLYVADQLSAKKNMKVELVVSSFSHSSKSQRDKMEQPENFDVTYIGEPSYKKNLSIKRLYAHKVLAKNIKKYFASRTKPDVIYCAVPSLSVGDSIRRYCKRHGIRFIIDVQDLWPEAFTLVLKPGWLANFLLWPLQRQANRIYRDASHVVTVSETYSARVGQERNGLAVDTIFLGTELSYFDECAQGAATRNDSITTLVYIGTLGHSYDILTLLEALADAHSQGLGDIRLLIMGDGPLEEEFRRASLALGIDHMVDFSGRLDYKEMVERLVSCDIAINPIVRGAAQSIINKVGDYAAAGLPVINTQENEEYKQLLNRFGAGLSCDPGDVTALSILIRQLSQDQVVRRTMGTASRLMAEELFDRHKIYPRILEIIQGK